MDGSCAHELLLVVAAASPWLPAFVCIDYHSQSGVARESQSSGRTPYFPVQQYRRCAMPLILASPKNQLAHPSVVCVSLWLPSSRYFSVLLASSLFFCGGSSRPRPHILSCATAQWTPR
ncbi:hypothetical protein GGI43DRAFT_395685 [Trichoderma evansii]